MQFFKKCFEIIVQIQIILYSIGLLWRQRFLILVLAHKSYIKHQSELIKPIILIVLNEIENFALRNYIAEKNQLHNTQAINENADKIHIDILMKVKTLDTESR